MFNPFKPQVLNVHN